MSSLDFAAALVEAEEDAILDWAATCGIDPRIVATLIQIHRDDACMVPGQFTATGQHMRAYEWFMLYRDGSIARYGHYLLRIHCYVMLQLCEDPDQVAALHRQIAAAKAEHPEDP